MGGRFSGVAKSGVRGSRDLLKAVMREVLKAAGHVSEPRPSDLDELADGFEGVHGHCTRRDVELYAAGLDHAVGLLLPNWGKGAELPHPAAGDDEWFEKVHAAFRELVDRFGAGPDESVVTVAHDPGTGGTVVRCEFARAGAAAGERAG